MKPYPSVEDLLRLLLRVGMPCAGEAMSLDQGGGSCATPLVVREEE